MISLSIALLLAAADAPAPPAAKPAKIKKICRTIMETESRLGKRICKTAEEWAGVDRDDRTKLDTINRQERQ